MKNPELADRHFTTCAVHIVEQLWPRAADRSMCSEVTEQTVPMLALWSILRWERKVGTIALERMGVKVDGLARDVDRAMHAAVEELRQQNGPPRLQTLPSGRRMCVVDFRTPLVPLLDAAEHEARDLGHDWVGSEHLFLAIIRVADTRLRKVLDRHKIEYDVVRQAVLNVLCTF